MESSYNSQSQSPSASLVPIKQNSESSEETKWGKGLWTREQKLRYTAFLNFNKESLNSKLLRRTSKIFKQMSKFIGSRSPSQCRSQNQKVYKKYRTINRIISAFKLEFGAESFDASFQELKKDHAIKFHTQFEFKSSSQLQQNRGIKKTTTETGMQTTSEELFVAMNMEEYIQWNAFKAMRCSVAEYYSQTFQTTFSSNRS